MLWLPAASVDVLKLAVVVPPAVLSVTWAMVVAPSEKVTTPVGLPVPLPNTVAVKVTLWFNADGLAEDTTAVVVPAWVTVWVMGVEVLVAKFVPPPYEAMMVWLPSARLEVVKLAVVVPPALLKVPWPMFVAPSEKVTTPVGLPGPYHHRLV